MPSPVFLSLFALLLTPFLFSFLILTPLAFHLATGQRDFGQFSTPWHFHGVWHGHFCLHLRWDIIVAANQKSPALAQFVKDWTTLGPQSGRRLNTRHTPVAFNLADAQLLMLTKDCAFLSWHSPGLAILCPPLFEVEDSGARVANRGTRQVAPIWFHHAKASDVSLLKPLTANIEEANIEGRQHLIVKLRVEDFTAARVPD